MSRAFDLICVGRCMVDLYCDQIGVPVAHGQSLSMYSGGCPTNIAVGAARQGLRVAMLTRVGADATGDFIVETLRREGIETGTIRRDPNACTPMVVAGIIPEGLMPGSGPDSPTEGRGINPEGLMVGSSSDSPTEGRGINPEGLMVRSSPDSPTEGRGISSPDRFPLTWYRERAADLEVAPEDFDDALIGSAHAVLLSGNSLSRPRGVAMARALVAACRRLGTRLVYDVDFRPVLWYREDAGGRRTPVPPDEVARILQEPLEAVDLLVGTEEEYAALTGVAEPGAAFSAARARLDPTGTRAEGGPRSAPGMAILKRGKDGAVLAAPGAEPERLPGFPVRVLNTLGAGDAFIAGFLAGWLRDEPLDECGRRANASGAIVVTRHGCSPAMPYEAEIRHFLDVTRPQGRSPQDDPRLQRLHVQGGRPQCADPLFVFAIDHRTWFQDAAPGADERIAAFKALAVDAVRRRARDAGLEAHVGFIVDGQFAASTLAELRGTGAWVAEPLERADAFPLRLLGPGGDPALALRERPRGGVVKLLVFCEDAAHAEQTATVLQVQAACEAYQRELLLEVVGRAPGADVAGFVERFIRDGVSPSWWKLPLPAGLPEWQRLRAALARDPDSRGVLFLGGGVALDALMGRLQVVAGDPMVRGFAVGRTVFEGPFRRYLAGAPPEAVGADVADGFIRLARAWPPPPPSPRPSPEAARDTTPWPGR